MPSGRSDFTPPVGGAVPVGEPAPVGEPVPVGELVPVGEPVPVGELVPVGEAVHVDVTVPVAESVQAGVAVPVDESVAVGDVVVVGEAGSVEVETLTEGDGREAVGEGVGGEEMSAPPWVDGDDDCPTTAAISLGPGFGVWSADCNLNTADLRGYSLRGTCESGWTEMKRATFSGECLGKSGKTRVRTAVIAAATAPAARMALVRRFHHRSGGGLAG